MISQIIYSVSYQGKELLIGENNMKNNLFYYATKELSQDAFICWLCSYAGEGAAAKDTVLTECAEHMLREFIG